MTSDSHAPENEWGEDSNWAIDPSQDQSTLRIVVTSPATPYLNSVTQQPPPGQSQHSQDANSLQHTNQRDSTSSESRGEELRQQFEDRGASGELGLVSDSWKKAASCLFLGVLTFFAATIAFFAFSMTINETFLYALAILTVVYVTFRFGFSYYVYSDAKAIRYHSRERRKKAWTDPQYGWTPNPFMWAFFTFVMPPFVEFGPAVVYFYNRHRNTGVP